MAAKLAVPKSSIVFQELAQAEAEPAAGSGNRFGRKSRQSPSKPVERVRNPPTKRVLALQESKKTVMVPKIEEPDESQYIEQQHHEVSPLSPLCPAERLQLPHIQMP